MRTFVYFNLRRRLFSVKALEGPKKGRVIAHRKALVLENCEFKVSEAGRQRVLRERVKNVHAGVTGTWRQRLPRGASCSRAITYNPYKGPHFIDLKTRRPVFRAQLAQLKDRRVYIR